VSARARLRAWAPLVAWFALIFVASSIPGDEVPVPPLFPHLDKLVHAAVYAVAGALAYRASGRVSWAILVVLAWGVSDELHQSFVPRRSPELLDLVADGVGGALGALLAHLTRRMRAR
jgi:VanZ family protein